MEEQSPYQKKLISEKAPIVYALSKSERQQAMLEFSRSGSKIAHSPDFDYCHLSSMLVQNLAASSAGGPDPDHHHRHRHHHINKNLFPFQKEDPSKHSFSEALRECQFLRSTRSEAADSLDASPRFVIAMSKTSAAVAATGNITSPGTPTYRLRHQPQPTASYQKGWSSERVPPPASSSRRHPGALLPYGRALPSKWEDAEKWIFSPGDNAGRYSVPQSHYRRPKSKSGPLGPPACLSSAASPLNPCFDRGRVGLRGFGAASPFLTGILVADRASYANGGGGTGSNISGGRSSSANAEPYIIRSASIHGWSDTIESPSSLPSSQDEKSDCMQETGSIISPSVLRKDVATQMSPEGSPRSSAKHRTSFSPSPSAHPIEELESPFSKLEVRDVQVDDRVTVTRWSKKRIARGSDRRSTNIIEWKKKTVEARGSSSCWEVAETAKSISKYKREEAKITAWENLQKAKAESEIRKLEMKLEKKRSYSMDKILNKLRSAQRKAQEMRSAVAQNQSQQVTRATKRSYYYRKTGQLGTLSGCFTCHAF